MNLQKLYIIGAFCVVGLDCFGQISYTGKNTCNPHPEMPLDTLNIYKSKAKTPYRIYKRHWFLTTGSYSYSPQHFSHQDSLVIYPLEPHYLKVYNKPFGHLIFEGCQWGYLFPMLVGDLKYFYKNGRLEHTEHYDYCMGGDTCGVGMGTSDAPIKWGNWKYYRKDGTIKREVHYFFKVYCDTKKYEEVKQTIKIQRSGISYSKKEHVLFSDYNDLEKIKKQ